MHANEYVYLWDGSSDAWALLHINADKPDEHPRYLIMNRETKRALLIRDDAVYARVKEEMLSHGVKIISLNDGS